jgi:cobalt/nickel transport system permease protein
MLLLRSFDRAERIYHAMKCRGYGASPAKGAGKRGFAPGDAICAAAVFLPCLLFRFVSVNALFSFHD